MRPTPRASAAIGLWNPTGHWLDAFPASSYLRLEPSIWQDYPGSLS
jgi:hypothetical protein